MGDVAILDCGAQYAKVIDRRVRELGVESDILPIATGAKDLRRYKAIIVSGGPSSVNAKDAVRYDPGLFSLGIPVLGICYGMQLIAHAHGGEVRQQRTKEYGEMRVAIDPSSPLFASLSRSEQVLMSHGDSVTRVPAGFRVSARSGALIAGIEDRGRRIYGVQFHPEVDLTLHGKAMLGNFLFGIAKLERTHTIGGSIERAVREIRSTVGKAKVVVLISGGVDSAVSAALLLKALPKEQVYGIHIDHGFMRKGESRSVMRALSRIGLANLRLVEAQDEFLDATTLVGARRIGPLRAVTDPEEKRKIIGDTFMRVSEREIARLKGKVFLAQGTLRPDLIESASELVTTSAQTIKTHHNDSALVREKRRQGLVVETNKDWHKDEVRKIARTLGLPRGIAQRLPFPGPGLAIRVLCASGAAASGAEDLVGAKAGVARIAKAHGLAGTVLPVRSVGVQGDERTYGYVAVLSGKFSWERLKAASIEIPKRVHAVNRVCWLVKGTAGTPRVVPTALARDTLDLLREADARASAALRREAPRARLAQLPIILLPVSLGAAGRAIVLRPFVTNDFMTGRAAIVGKELPLACVRAMAREVSSLEGIGAVLYDLTSKPPGTTEWE